MDETWIKIMKKTKRLKLSNWQLFMYYAIVFAFLLISILNLYSVFKIEITGTYTGVRSTQDHLTAGLPWLIPAVVFGIVQFRRLNFKRLEANISPEEFKSIALKAGKEMKWSFINLTNDYAIATTGFNWASWGERITIIRCENEILINSICDPDNHASVSSWGQNRKNINAFKKRIKILSEKVKASEIV